MKTKTYIAGFVFFLICAIVLFLSGSIVTGIFSLLFSFAAIYASYLERKTKDRDFFELNGKGIAYILGGMKTPQEIEWSNISRVGREEPMGKLTGPTLQVAAHTRFALFTRNMVKPIGLNLKDTSVLPPQKELSKTLSKGLSDFDVIIPDVFDLEKIYPLLVKYLNNPQLRTELDDQNSPS